jgi:hypothetical protein
VKLCTIFAGKRAFSSEQETVQDQRVTGIAPYSSRHFLPSVLARKTTLPHFRCERPFTVSNLALDVFPNWRSAQQAQGNRRSRCSCLRSAERFVDQSRQNDRALPYRMNWAVRLNCGNSQTSDLAFVRDASKR